MYLISMKPLFFSYSSRLVCAIEVTEEMDGIEIKVPIATNDARGA